MFKKDMFVIEVSSNFFTELIEEVRFTLEVPPKGLFELALKARYQTLVKANVHPISAFTAALGQVLAYKAHQQKVELLEQGVRASRIIIQMDVIGEVATVGHAAIIKKERALWLACFWMCRLISVTLETPEYLSTWAIELLHQQVVEMFQEDAEACA
jgi:hypothetical protein